MDLEISQNVNNDYKATMIASQTELAAAWP